MSKRIKRQIFILCVGLNESELSVVILVESRFLQKCQNELLASVSLSASRAANLLIIEVYYRQWIHPDPTSSPVVFVW